VRRRCALATGLASRFDLQRLIDVMNMVSHYFSEPMHVNYCTIKYIGALNNYLCSPTSPNTTELEPDNQGRCTSMYG
jgi:hypothetical protein